MIGATGISNRVDSEQMRLNEAKVASFNAELKAQNQQVNHALGQADFFQILSAQLANQDPLKPMEDKEFIAQMAQFSSLDQIKGMSASMQELSGYLKDSSSLNMFSGAVSLLGKEATVQTAYGSFSGAITQVTGGADPQVKIGNDFYGLSDITKVQQ